MAKISLFRVSLSIVVLNAVGILLRYFQTDTYIILLGFRFHLSSFLPLLVLFPPGFSHFFKEILTRPADRKKFLPAAWIILSFISLLALLYLMNKIDIADPDYFYEFGLSSIFDYPIYLAWNFPQLLLLFTYLFICSYKRNRFLVPLVLTILLYVYEFIPLGPSGKGKTVINYYLYAEPLLCALAAAFAFRFCTNVYWFSFIMFSLLWSNLLAFGTHSAILVNNLFAAQYNEWEGFFTVSKEFTAYVFSAQIIFLLLFISLSLPFRKRNREIESGLNLTES